MATPYVLKDCKFYVAGYDLSGDTNAIRATEEFDEVPAAVFGKPARYSIPGLATVAFEHQGYADSNTTEPEDVLATRLQTASVPMMIAPSGAVATPAYFSPQMITRYQWGGAVGEMNAFTVSGVGQGQGLIPGTIMATGSKNSTANGTAYELGAVTAATNYLYAMVQVFSVSGTNPTLDLLITSDDAEGFSGPATKITFAQIAGASVPTAVWATPVAGAITDTWWRAQWTIGGSDTPTFDFAVAVGIR